MKNTTHLIFGMLALTFGMEAMAQMLTFHIETFHG